MNNGDGDRFIVKLQVSLQTSCASQMALAYNEDRTIEAEHPANLDILTLMGGFPKRFFYARLIDNNIAIEGEAPWQDW